MGLPWLLDTPVQHRFVSAEPLLEELDLSAWLEPGGLNTAYEPSGKPISHRGLVREGEVQCRVHDGGGSDRAYDYDCVATLRDPNGCTRFFPFYVERSSVGPIARPVSEDLARATIRRFGLLSPGQAC